MNRHRRLTDVELSKLRFPAYRVEWFLRRIEFDEDHIRQLILESDFDVGTSANLGEALYRILRRRVFRVRRVKGVARLRPGSRRVLEAYAQMFGYHEACDGDSFHVRAIKYLVAQAGRGDRRA